MTYTEKRCCDKCYHDIENGIVFTIFQCEECPCHKAIAQAIAEERARVVDNIRFIYDNYWLDQKIQTSGNPKTVINREMFINLLSSLDNPLSDK